MKANENVLRGDVGIQDEAPSEGFRRPVLSAQSLLAIQIQAVAGKSPYLVFSIGSLCAIKF